MKIIWSAQARNDYWQNIDYLIENWSEKEASHFIELIDHNIYLISQHPKIFPLTDYPDVRRSVITPQVSLFYRVRDKNTIELIRFWNNHQDPEKLNI